MTESPELAAKAAQQQVVVIGGGIGGLVAARECAKVGMPVTLLEAESDLGGAIRRAEIDGIVVDAGAESFATRGGHVRRLAAELGLADRIVSPEGGGAWVDGIEGVGAAPLPVGGVLGIPENPFADDVRRIIGRRGAWRAYVDRLRPPMTIGRERSLGRLVAARMGDRVRDRLVAPVTAGVYSAHPDDVDVDIAAPGLSAALTTTGSLSGAVASLRDARGGKAPGSAVEGIDGGMHLLVEALRADLETLGVDVRVGVAATALSRTSDGWAVEADATGRERSDAGAGTSSGTVVHPQDAASSSIDHGDADAERRGSPDAGGRMHATDDGAVTRAGGLADAAVTNRQDRAARVTLLATAVIVATPEPVARELIGAHVADLGEPSDAPQIEIVTLVLTAPELDAAPRGTGVLTVPGSRVAKALTHATAKWGWLRRDAGDRHIVRVSFGTQGEAPATAGLDDVAASALALEQAAAMLGVPLDAGRLVGAHRSGFVQTQPASVIGAADRRALTRAAVQKTSGLAVVGAWLAGTGLAQVVPDATAEADRLRRALLFG